MFCSACGQQLQPSQAACPKCGRPVNANIPSTPQQVPVAAGGPYPGTLSRVERHIHTLGVMWLVYAGWLLITWAFAATFMAGFLGMQHHWGPWGHMGPFGPEFPFGRVPWLIPFITFMLVARSILGIVTGVGLLHRERWGRILAIVAGVLVLLKPVLGTALGIYTLWVLVPSDSAREYDEIAR
jgi:hypothetical protein